MVCASAQQAMSSVSTNTRKDVIGMKASVDGSRRAVKARLWA
jgi:hypothetical protein